MNENKKYIEARIGDSVYIKVSDDDVSRKALCELVKMIMKKKGGKK